MLIDYAKRINIEKEPAFDWWVKHTLRKPSIYLGSQMKRVKNRSGNKLGHQVVANMSRKLSLSSKLVSSK